MKRLLLIVLISLLWSVGILAQTTDSLEQTSLFEPISEVLSELTIFDNEKPLDLTLKYDITSFIKKKQKGEYLDAEFRLHINETDSIVKNIRLKARGNFRRGHCFFPPIYLNFKTDPIKTSELEEIKKIKLVTHCSGSKAYQEYILKEYLAYKIYNVITNYSLRVKLLNINYIDTGKKKRNYQRPGFLIEPVDLLTKRTNSVEVDGIYIRENNVVEADADIAALFQYLIANTDWRIKGGHNMKYVKSLEDISTKVIPVPYDFDYSGFVGTTYSIPQEWTSIDNVKEREYLGYCRKNEQDYLNTITLFAEKENEIMETINSFHYLDEKDRRNLVKYIEDFFKLAERPDVFVNILKRECRTNF
ncbi:MAG: hypothetical protein ABFS16_12170 [Bacteroidota bacterium]